MQPRNESLTSSATRLIVWTCNKLYSNLRQFASRCKRIKTMSLRGGQFRPICKSVVLLCLIAVAQLIPAPEASAQVPDISISSKTVSVAEGTPAVLFDFTSTATSGQVAIQLAITETGSFISETEPPGETFFVLGGLESGQSAPLEIKLKADDSVFAADSTITVRILAGNGYNVSGEGRASVTVLDNDTPTGGISIVAVESEPVAEGTDAHFQIRSDTAVNMATTVIVNLADGGGGFLKSASPQTVIIAAGGVSEILAVETNNLTSYKPANAITATVASATKSDNSTIAIVASANSDTVTIKSDNPLPNVPRVSIERVREQYVEGEMAKFRVSLASDQTHTFPISVAVNTTHTGTNFIADAHATSDTIVFQSTANTVGNYSVLTESRTGTADGTITVEIVQDPVSTIKYLPADPPNNKATLTIKHNTPKTVSISAVDAVAHGVTEGRSFEVTVTSTPAPEFSDLPVSLSSTGFGTLGMMNPSPIVIPAGSSSATTSISTLDRSGQSDGTFVISVGTSSDGRYTAANSPNNSISVTIKDNDSPTTTNPQISIAPKSTTIIAEGQPAEFTVSATPPPSSDIAVRINVSEAVQGTDSYLATPAGIRNFTFDHDMATVSGNVASLPFAVPTQADRLDEQNGMINAEVVDGIGYTLVAGSGNTAVRTVESRQIIPVLSLTPNKVRITEGRSFEFTVAADVAPVKDTNVVINLTTVGLNPQQNSTPHTFNPSLANFKIRKDNLSETITFTAADVATTTPLIIEIAPSQSGDYRTPATSSQDSFSLNATILDNDNPSLSNPRFSIEPAASVSPYVVQEGSAINFRISSVPPPRTDVRLNLDVSQVGGTAVNSVGKQTITYPARMPSHTYSITDVKSADTTNDPDVVVTVMLLEGAGPDPTPNDGTNENGVYSLADSNFMAIATVSDETPSLPAISVTAVDSDNTVNEGQDIQFTFNSTIPLASSLDINIAVSETGSFLEDGELAKSTARLSAGSNTNFTLDIKGRNSIFEPDSKVKLEIKSGTNYTVVHPTIAEVTVLDSNTPTGISIIPISDTATEGETARFQIKSHTSFMTDREIRILVDDDDESDFIANTEKGIKTATLAAGAKSVEHPVPLRTDSDYEVNGRVTVSIQPGIPANSYVVNTSHKEASIALLDDDIPNDGISIVAFTDSVSEADEVASFQITSQKKFATIQPIKIRVTETGSFIDTSSSNMDYPYTEVEIPAGEDTVRLDVKIHDDSIREADGFVQVTIRPDGSANEYELADSNTSASIAVMDNETGEIPPSTTSVISIEALNVAVSEGENAMFQIKSDQTSTEQRVINISVDDGTDESRDGGFLSSATRGSQQVTIPANQQLVGYSIVVESDNVPEPDRFITVSVEPATPLDSTSPSSNYTIAADSVNNSASILATDDDTPDDISVFAITNSVNEGEDALFQITSKTTSAQPRVIAVVVDDGTGDFIDRDATGNPPSSVTIPANAKTAMLSVATDNDRVHEVKGTITVEIQDSAIRNANHYSATATVVSEDGLPEISIKSIDTQIDEGQPARFEVQALDRVSSMELSIMVRIANTHGDFLANSPGVRTVKLPAMQTKAPILAEITNANSIDESNGEITATVVSGTDYEADLNNASSSVTVIDNDDPNLPSVSISNTNNITKIDEGMAAEFSLVASPLPQSPIVVQLSITENGNFLANSNRIRDVNVGTDGATTFKVDTVADETEEGNGLVTVTILSDPLPTDTYGVGSAFRTSINLTDNDRAGLPIFNITANSETIEGNDVLFVLTREAGCTPSSTPIEVTIEVVQQQGSFLADSEKRREVSVKNECLTEYRLSTKSPNGIDEPDGVVTATLVSDPNDPDKYAVGAQITASVTIVDGDDLPTLSFQEPENVLENAGIMTFTVQMSHRSEREVSVSFTIRNGTATLGTDFDIATASPLRIPKGELQADIELTLFDNDVFEWEEDFFIRLSVPSNAKFPDDQKFIETRGVILEDDPDTRPVVSMTVPETANEGDGKFPVTLTVDPAPQNSELTINTLTVANANGNYYKGLFPNPIVISGKDNGVGTVYVLLTDNDKYDGWGELTLTLAETKYYKLPNDERAISANVTVTEDEKALAKISIMIAQDEVDEGNPIDVVFTADPPPAIGQTIEIDFAVTETNPSFGNLGTYTPKQLSISNANRSANLSITTIRNNRYKENGEITVTINRGDGYEVVDSPTDESDASKVLVVKRVKVAELDDYVPEIAIEPDASSLEEGTLVNFTITADPVPRDRELEVGIVMAQKGDVVKWPIPETIVFGIGESTHTLNVATDDNRVKDSNDRELTITIKESTNYHIDSTKNPARVTITDNDSPGSSQIPLYSVAANVITSILLEIPETPLTNGNDPVDIANLPTVSIAPVVLTVSEGTPAEFTITSSQVNDADIQINIRLTQDGDFITGALARAVKLVKGETSASMLVATDDDNVAEEDGAIRAEIVAGSGYRIGNRSIASVSVSDLADRLKRQQKISAATHAVLPDLLASVGARSLETAHNRFVQNFNASNATSFEFAGQSAITEALKSGGKSLNDESKSWRSILGDSSFSLDLFPEEEAVGYATIWGHGDYRNLASRSGLNFESWDGDVFTGHFGMEARTGQNVLTGLTASMSESEIDYGEFEDDGLKFDARTTGLHPYFVFGSQSNERNLQLIGGMGRTDIEIHQENHNPATVGGEFFNLGTKGQSRLYASDSIFNWGQTDLNLEGESWIVRQFIEQQEENLTDSRIDSSHFRFSISGTSVMNLDRGSSFTPSFFIGMRGDNSISRSFTGLELENGLHYEGFNGLLVSGSNKLLLADGKEVQQWNVRSKFDFDSDRDGLGLQINVEPNWNRNFDAIDRVLWRDGILDADYEAGLYAAGNRIKSEVGYGIEIPDQSSVLTLTSGIDLVQDGNKQYLIGNGLKIDSNLLFEMNASRTFQMNGQVENKLELTGKVSW